MKSTKIMFITIFALISVACFWSEEQPNSNVNLAENLSANQTANSAPNEETNRMPPTEGVVTQTETDVIPKTEDIKSLKTPTETYKTFTVATFNKDLETIKQSISAGSLQYVENAAKQQNTTVSELLTGGAVQNIARKIPEIKNEKVDGNKASIQVKNEAGLYDTIPLVKENGEWKVALDTLGRQAQEKFDEMKKRLSDGK